MEKLLSRQLMSSLILRAVKGHQRHAASCLDINFNTEISIILMTKLINYF